MSFFHGTRLRSKGDATGEPRGPNGHGPCGHIPWPRGAYPFFPRCSGAVDLHLVGCVTKGSAAETQKHEIKAREIEDWREKLRRGAVGVISIPSNGSTFVAMMKGGSPPLDYRFVAVAICISLLFFIVLAPYELHNMIMAIFVSLSW
jgi:hypothetical protein